MRVDKAVNVSMELMRGKGLPVIYFLSAISSLLCQNNGQSAEYVKSCNLILAGDRHIEMAVHHRQDNGQIPEGIGEFADNYLKRLFSKINREGRSIYMVMEQESYLESMEEYMERAILFLSYLRKDIVVQRIVGRASGGNTLSVNGGSPWWEVKDRIDRLMEERNVTQGCLCDYLDGKAVRHFLK